MSLKVLMLEEEPELEISYVPLAGSDEPAADPEMPEEYIVQAEMQDFDNALAALESILPQIACEGMDVSTARKIDLVSPGFLLRNGGIRAFTSTPSLEGLAEGAAAVQKGLAEMVQRVRKFVADMYRRFKEWLTTRFSSPESQEIKKELETFLAERRNLEAIKYLAELPEDIEEAAAEVARFMDGETKEFASNLANQFQSLMKRVENLEEAMRANPTHFRLARGVVTVKELFGSDDGIRNLLRKVRNTGNVAMQARTAEQFVAAIQAVDAMTAEMNEFKQNFVVNDEVSDQFGDNDKPVSFDKLYENINKATTDMQSISIKNMVEVMTVDVSIIVELADETKIEDILEMIPEDVPQEQHNAYAQKVAAMYRTLSVIGKDLLRLWKVRADSVRSINTIGDALMGLVDSFEKAVAASMGNLTPEQKTQLAKALAGKGLKVEI